MGYSDYFKGRQLPADRPACISYFINTLLDFVANEMIGSLKGETFNAEMSCRYPYDSKCLSVVEKTLNKYGYKTSVKSYKWKSDTSYSYVWKVEKKS